MKEFLLFRQMVLKRFFVVLRKKVLYFLFNTNNCTNFAQ